MWWKEKLYRLAANDEFVILVENEKEKWRFRRDEVTRIATYKRDLLTTDLICLDFFVGAKNLTYSTHEEISGFNDLQNKLLHHFPGGGYETCVCSKLSGFV
jgi:hypothetical protein